ncbi:MAG: AsmA family protein [Gammaproteobacteria bacterium]|nr:AsmA family protein [Gammaproteobacteria bacterium]
MKVLKVLVLSIVVLVALVVAGAGIFVATFNPNQYKDQLIARVKAETGRELTLDGPLELALWPKLRLKAGPLKLGNAAGFGSDPMLSASEIQVAVATLPLLEKRIEMDTVVLHGVSVNLARNAEGRGNWEDLAKPAAAGDGNNQKSSGAPIAALILGGVDIKDASFKWQDATTGQTLVLDKLTASTGALTFGKPIDLALSATAKANQPALDADIKLTGTLNYNVDDKHYVLAPLVLTTDMRGATLPGGTAKLELDAGLDLDLKGKTAKLSGLKLSGLGTEVSGEFSARDIEAARPSASGQLLIKGSDMAQIFNAFALPAGKQLAGVSDRSFDFTTAFDANMDSGEVKVSKLEGKILGAQLNGAFTASAANTDKPTAKGNLHAHGPDLPTLVAVIAQLQGANGAMQKQLSQALAGSRDKSFDVNVDLDVDMGAGKAALPRLDAKLLGNEVSGHVAASNAASDKPAVQGELKASGADLPALLAVAAGLQGKDSSLAPMAQSLAKESNKSFNFESGFDADLAKGRMSLSKLSAELAGVSLRGNLDGNGLDFANKQGKLTGKLVIESSDTGPLLRAVGQGEMAQSVKSLKLDTGVEGGLDDMRLSPLSVVARVASPELPQAVDLQITAASAHANLKNETASIKALAITGLGLNARADIDAEKIMSAPRYSGKLAVPSFNPRSLMKTLNKPVPNTADAKALTALAIDTTFSGTTSSIKLDSLAVTLDDSHLKGNIDVAAFSGPDMRFTLALDSLNADRYLEPPKKDQGKTVVTPDAAVAGAANALPVEQLRGLKIKGELTAGALQISGAKMKNVKFAIDAAKGLIKLDPLAAQLYEGAYQGAVVTDARGAQVGLALNTRLTKVQIEPLLKDTANNESLSGAVSFDAALKAAGGDSAHVKQSLGGQGHYAIDNGVFRGVDAVAILRAVEQIIECKCVVPVPKGGQTQFKSLAGTLAVKNGVIRNDDLLMTGEGFTIKGRGMLVNLNDNTIKYDLSLGVTEQRTTTATNTFKLGGYEVPIACRGQVDSPSCLPDFGHILGDVAKDAAKKKIEKAVGKKLKGLIDGKDGDTIKNLLKF